MEAWRNMILARVLDHEREEDFPARFPDWGPGGNEKVRQLIADGLLEEVRGDYRDLISVRITYAGRLEHESAKAKDRERRIGAALAGR